MIDPRCGRLGQCSGICARVGEMSLFQEILATLSVEDEHSRSSGLGP